MIININSENDVFYNACDLTVSFLNLKWREVSESFRMPVGYKKIARAGRFEFYADTLDIAYEKPRYCVIHREVIKNDCKS